MTSNSFTRLVRGVVTVGEFPEDRSTEEIYQRLREEDVKLTNQRRLIVRVLAQCRDEHPSVDELHSIVREEDPDVGLATVYRTLDLLQRLDLVQTLDVGDGRTRYELATGMHQHHHLLCLQCGKIEEVDRDLLGAVEDTVEELAGFRVVDHELKMFGVCRNCQLEAQQ